MKQILKVLSKEMKSPINGNFQYEIGVDYHCPDFDDTEEACSRGFYGCEIDSLIHWMRVWKGHRLFECSVWGKSRVFEAKERWEFIRLDRELSKEEIIELCKAAEPRLCYNLSEALYPLNPLSGDPNVPTEIDIDLLERWIKVNDSVCDSVYGLVYGSVWDLVYDSIRASIRASVRDSVYDSVHAYVGHLFPNIVKWEYVDHEVGVYPFQPSVDLWCRGFVPSFDGKVWRLHSGKDAAIVYTRGKK